MKTVSKNRTEKNLKSMGRELDKLMYKSADVLCGSEKISNAFQALLTAVWDAKYEYSEIRSKKRLEWSKEHSYAQRVKYLERELATGRNRFNGKALTEATKTWKEALLNLTYERMVNAVEFIPVYSTYKKGIKSRCGGCMRNDYRSRWLLEQLSSGINADMERPFTDLELAEAVAFIQAKGSRSHREELVVHMVTIRA